MSFQGGLRFGSGSPTLHSSIGFSESIVGGGGGGYSECKSVIFSTADLMMFSCIMCGFSQMSIYIYTLTDVFNVGIIRMESSYVVCILVMKFYVLDGRWHFMISTFITDLKLSKVLDAFLTNFIYSYCELNLLEK